MSMYRISTKQITELNLAKLAVTSGLIILVIHPVEWLVNSWIDPSYDSYGYLMFLLCGGLFIWSVTSDRIFPKPVNYKLAVTLLLSTAFIRLVGQVLAINVIGAIALAIDVYAIGLLAGLQHRKRAVSPAWLAVIFAFSLPVERIIQRIVGYKLQLISADGSCFILNGLFDEVTCSGIRILLAGKDVLVDLPCSGAKSLMLFVLFYSFMAAVNRTSITANVAGFLITLLSALAANILRIVILAIGIAYPEKLFGINVMESPWHDTIGLIALASGCLPIIIWASRGADKTRENNLVINKIKWLVPEIIKRDGWWLEEQPAKTNRSIIVSLVFLAAAVIIVNLSGNPVDVSKKSDVIILPSNIANYQRQQVELTEKEKAYFTMYGGSAAKAQYGENSLMVIKTSLPLRHLHSPDECLRGLDFKVEYQGLVHEKLPTAIYRVISPDNKKWRVAVSFVSDKGHRAASVSEAVWIWFKEPNTEWTAIQRISPWDNPTRQIQLWEESVLTALDLDKRPVLLSTKFNATQLEEISYD